MRWSIVGRGLPMIAIAAVVLLACTAEARLQSRPAVMLSQPGVAMTGAVYPLGPLQRVATPSDPTGWAPDSYHDTGPNLFLVDHEGVTGPGLLARGVIQSARLFAYLVPHATTPLTFIWVLYNRSSHPITVQIRDRAAAPPGLRYLSIASRVQGDFLRGSRTQSFTIAPGQIHLLRNVSTTPASRQELAFSIIDLHASAPLQALDIATTSLAGITAQTLPTVFSAGPGRSVLYPHDRRDLDVTVQGSSQPINIAGGLPDDPYMSARDQITGKPDPNVGNFGVSYALQLLFPAGRARTVDLWVRPQGCPLVADVRWIAPSSSTAPVVRLPSIGSIPPGGLGLGTSLAALRLPGGMASTLRLEMLPPAAACTPVIITVNQLNPASSVVQLYQRAVWDG